MLLLPGCLHSDWLCRGGRTRTRSVHASSVGREASPARQVGLADVVTRRSMPASGDAPFVIPIPAFVSSSSVSEASRPASIRRWKMFPPTAGCASHRIANRGGSVLAAAIVGPAIRLPITIEKSFKLSDDLLARGGSSRRAEEGPVRVFEMEQKPVLEARCRDGRGELHSAFLPEWVLLQPVTESSDFRGSFVVVEDAPDLVQIGIQIAFLLNRCRDARRSPLSALRASDGHARKIEVADESQEVAWIGPGSFAQDQDSRQTRPSSGSSSRGARLSSPGLSCGHRARILR